ncbi:MAG: hypothetical protein ABI629_23135 [bacterium]
MTRLRALIGLVPLLFTTACGTSGGPDQSRPIEVSYYVTGAQGTQFQFVSSDAPCGALPGTGIQSPNVDHQFGDRMFETPYLFVLENAKQPIRATVRNMSANEPIQVNLYLGETPQRTGDEATIRPGECRTIESGSTRNITIKPRGVEAQVEICSPLAGAGTPCLDSQSSVDRHINYFATIGDLVASNLTNCILPSQNIEACTTPSTFFVENPQDQVSAVMNVNPGQGVPGQPNNIRMELYVNGEPVLPSSRPDDADQGNEPAVVKNL